MTSAPERSPVPGIADPTVRRSEPTRASTRKTAVFVGLLFLTATTAFIFADTLNTGVLSQPDFLTGASAETNALATGALLLSGSSGLSVSPFSCFPC